MKKHILKSRSFWLLIVIVFLLGCGSLYSFGRWYESKYFGKVISTSTGSFVIDDKRVGQREIFVTEKTRISKGRERLDMPIIGDEVFIVGEKNVEGKIDALGVRIIQEKNKR